MKINTVTNPYEYSSYKSMLNRCYNPNSDSYHRYGGRGITVCDRWRESFENFVADMGSRPISMTIERINNNGYYEPSNCRWATQKEQSNNKSSNSLLTIGDKESNLKQWSEKSGISSQTIQYRLNSGTPHEDLFNPTIYRQTFTFEGEEYTLIELSKKFNILEATLRYRLTHMKLSVVEAVNYSNSGCVEIDGKNITYSELSKKSGISKSVMQTRTARGTSGSDLTLPLRRNRKFLYKENLYDINQLAEIANITYGTMRRRLIDLNMSVEESVETPLKTNQYR